MTDKIIDISPRIIGEDEPNLFNNTLHDLVVNRDYRNLQSLIFQKQCDINGIYRGNNALHTLIKHLRNCKETEEYFVEHVKLLLEAGIDVNKKDESFNKTAIDLANINGFKLIVKTILEESAVEVNLTEGNSVQTAQKFNNDKSIKYEEIKISKLNGPKTLKENLFELIRERKEEEFVTVFNENEIYANRDDDDGTYTFLQYSCDKNCLKIVKFLCSEREASIEKTAINNANAKKPLHLAITHGFHKIVEFLVVVRNAQLDGNALSYAIKRNVSPFKSDDIDYEKCLNILVNNRSEDLRRIVNEKDAYGNTPLSYAVKWGSSELTEKLLKNGANLGIENKQNVMPIENIDSEILEKYLDSCITVSEDLHIQKGIYNNAHHQKLILNVDSLIPKESSTKEIIKNLESENVPLEQQVKQNLKCETTVINFIANSSKLKHLVKHPVIVCLLLIKWHRIRYCFFANVGFYITFMVALNTYIFMNYTNFNRDTPKWYDIMATGSFVILIVMYVLLLFRELFQFIISPKKYPWNFENLLEVCLLVTTFIILFDTSITKQSSAFAIVLSSFEFVLMFSQFTQHVVMFRRVAVHFFQIFFWFSLLITAFALSFKVLSTKNSSKDVDKEGGWVVKALVMLVGELGPSSIDFDVYPVVSRIIFIIFVFTIPIILVNLLNGLAVSDTQAIKNDAELVTLLGRTKLINHFETLLIGNELDKTGFSCFYLKSTLSSCLNNFTIIKYLRMKLIKKLYLFSTSSSQKNQIFMSSSSGRLTLDKKFDGKILDTDEEEITCCNFANKCVAGEKLIQKAVNITKQKKATNKEPNFDQILYTLNMIYDKLFENKP